MNTFYKETDQNKFFNLLPEDWNNEISITWNTYSKNATIYVLEGKDKIMAGGIVFSICPPDMLYNPLEAKKWFDQGYLYIGFIWVVEEFRNKKVGSKWIKSLINKFPQQKFWLTIEEESLKFFYIKNGFSLVKTLQNDNNKEWLLIYEPKL